MRVLTSTYAGISLRILTTDTECKLKLFVSVSVGKIKYEIDVAFTRIGTNTSTQVEAILSTNFFLFIFVFRTNCCCNECFTSPAIKYDANSYPILVLLSLNNMTFRAWKPKGVVCITAERFQPVSHDGTLFPDLKKVLSPPELLGLS